MGRNKSHSSPAVIDARRREVARFRLQGYTQREITHLLSRPLKEGGLRNPKTGKPWTLTTIHRDLKELRKAWQKDASRDMAEHLARHLAELRELRHAAWEDPNLDIVLRGIVAEIKLLGTAAPERHKIGGDADGVIVFKVGVDVKDDI